MDEEALADAAGSLVDGIVAVTMALGRAMLAPESSAGIEVWSMSR